jgi:tripartite-type tricarboxylate transporter receptor subunit TctC
MIGRRAATLGALAVALPASMRPQAAWPAKPIRLVVPYGPGGSAD